MSRVLISSEDTNGYAKLTWMRGIFTARISSLFLIATLLFVGCLVVVNAHTAFAGINPQMSFQGKLSNPDGTNVADGSYSVLFTIYSGGTDTGGGTSVWSETQTVNVTDGVFHVQLGSVSPLTAVNFNDNTLYLSMQVGTDPEMSPYIRLSSSPYAFNSGALGGLSSDAFVQLGQGMQVDSSSANPSIGINKTAGSADIVTLQRAGNNVVVIANNGSASFYNTSGSTVLLATDASTEEASLGSGTLTVGADGSITRQIAAGKSGITYLDSGSQSKYMAIATQSADLLVVDNSGQAPVVDNVNGIHITYSGGNAAVSGSGMRIDYTPGGTSGGSWSGLRVVASAVGAASGVESSGITLEGPTSSAGGKNTAIKIASGWDIGLDIGSGGMELANQSDPAAPAVGHLLIYAKTVSGRMLLKAIGPNGVDYPLQPSLFQNQVSIINVQSGTASNYFGTSRSVTGTGIAAAYSEAYGYMGGYSTGGTANTSAGIGDSGTRFARGSTTGANGFFMNIRGALEDSDYTTGSGVRIFVGMTDQTVANSVASQNRTGNRAAFSFDSGRGDTNWMFSTKDGTTENLVDTGMPFISASAYDWYIYVPPYPNNDTMYWRIDNLTAGTSKEGTVATNLPAGATALRTAVSIRNLDATTRTINYQRIYVESDR